MAQKTEDEVTPGSVLRDLIFNQYQAILAGGAALASVVALNPLPLLVWLGSELVMLPILDSGPLRRLVHRRRREVARGQATAERARLMATLSPPNARRYAAMENLCRQIAQNYQSLTGISQAYLSEQRGKLEVILSGCLHRLLALQRYERVPIDRNPAEIEEEISALEAELTQQGLPPRAAAALTKNLELKRKLLASVSGVGDNVRALSTEIDSMESLLEVLHQNSISLRDPAAIADELDNIVRQSEDSERVVREMEALLRSEGGEWRRDLESQPAEETTAPGTTEAGRPRTRTR